jgi:Cu-processing system permease protein
MRSILRISRYVVVDVLRNRWVLGYCLFFAVAADLLLRLTGTGPRTMVSLLNLILLLIPLVTIVFVTIYWHGAREFTELLLTQPVDRPALFHGLFAGVVAPLSLAFAAGVTAPLLMHRAVGPADAGELALLLAIGVALTAVFGAIAVLIAGMVEDRLRGLGLALGAWLLFAVAYDGILLWVTIAFREYRLERPLLVLTFANPIDLARVLLLVRLDVAAVTGATGALFERELGGTTGLVAALCGLLAWTLVPGLLALRAFRRRDL